VKLPSEERKRHFVFKDKNGELDDIFVWENIIVVNENTTQSSDVHKHLVGKKILFDKIVQYPDEFIELLEKTFPNFKDLRDPLYPPGKCKLILTYSSYYDFEDKHKAHYPNVKFFDYAILRYFKEITSAIKRSARFEIFDFLGLSFKDIGEEALKPSNTQSEDYRGSILPEDDSGFDKNYKVISFYIDASALLSRSYVLRSEGWKPSEGGYQRMFVRNKIKSLREYLTTERRVFVNNIIVTLPHSTRILDDKMKTVEVNTLNETEPVIIQLPTEFNCIGLVDGQHRVYAYYEGEDQYEKKIAPLRKRQNLLVTGVIYPDGTDMLAKSNFEARLFLEINANQSNANSELKQAIELILKPFSQTAMAKGVITRMARKGPLESKLHEHFFDEKKIKTTTIVSYGLMPIVKLKGNDSLFSLWSNPDKEQLLKNKDEELLAEYKNFCADELDNILNGVKMNIGPLNLWTTDRNVSKFLTPKAINGFINCLRLLIENGKTGSVHYYAKKLKGIDELDIDKYSSSHYYMMGQDIYNDYFK